MEQFCHLGIESDQQPVPHLHRTKRRDPGREPDREHELL